MAGRWKTETDQLAVAVRVEDVPGFFSKTVIVEPGTMALVIEEGQYLGEVGPGTYTLESFAEGLAFWRQKQALVVLTKQEDTIVDICCEKIPTAENLMVDATVRLSLQIDDVALFTKNLLGTRHEFKLQDMSEMLLPFLQQSLWEVVGRLSITDLTGTDAREQVDAAIEQTLGMAIRRYGIRFIQVELLSVRHEKYDEHLQKMGEVWLAKEGLSQTDALNELYTEEELLKVKQLERENELALLAENVGIDKEEGELAAELRRIGIRNQMRAAVLSEDFDKLNNKEEFEKFLHEYDKGQLLRKEERDELVEGFAERKDDRAAARKHLLAKLDLERSMEIDQVRERLDYEMKVKRLDHEIQLAQMTGCKENLEWQQQLERERRAAEHRRQERDKQTKQELQWAREEANHRRGEQWENIVHKQRVDRLEGEIEVAQAERQNRITRLDAELKLALENEQFGLDKRKKEFELEVGDREAKRQLEKLAAAQEENAKAARLKIELEQLRDERVHAREVARLDAMKSMSYEALVATADPTNAAQLAELKKHEATQQAAVAQASGDKDKEFQEERARLQQQLTDAEKSKADAIAAAFSEAMKAQQQTADKALDVLGKATEKPDTQTPVVVVPGSGTPQTVSTGRSSPNRVVICPSCRAENPENSRHCSACGNQL